MDKIVKNIVRLLVILTFSLLNEVKAVDFADNSFCIAKISSYEINSSQIWDFLKNNDWNGIELDIDSSAHNAFIRNSRVQLADVLFKVEELLKEKESKIFPIFINYSNDIELLDSIINASTLSSQIFYLPQGEKWPSNDYLVQANRRVIFFVQGAIEKQSRILHHIDDYALQIGASRITPNSVILNTESNINKELFKIAGFHRLPTGVSPNLVNSNMYPDYINFLLESWTKYGKKPNFIFVGNRIYSFNFIVSQLNSYEVIKGQVRTTGKNLERVYWRNAETLITGGKFSFPIRGGEEMALTPFVPGFSLTPSQLIITAEMAIPEQYSIIAHPLELNQGLMASFSFDNALIDLKNPTRNFEGNGYTFTQDIDRGSVLKLPENANINLGKSTLYGFPNSSFTVACFVKFTDILEFGDNAILGNDEIGYRRGMHLVLRSGHPYFGLWANDYMSTETLEPNTWYHLAWRYIIETGQQAIFVNGQYIGGSDGHPPYSGTTAIHIGSALSRGASLRGYIDNLHIWNRPLGNEEINRLSLDEEIQIEKTNNAGHKFSSKTKAIAIAVAIFLLLMVAAWILFRRIKLKKQIAHEEAFSYPEQNRLLLFGEFKAINAEGSDISELFTPKMKELLIFTLIQTLKNGIGAAIPDLNQTLWEGIEHKKVANNRAVTLNKLRKLLVQFEQIEILSNQGYLQLKTSDSFFCDYIEAFKLCQIPEEITRQQLQTFFHLVKKGSLLKGVGWPWLDEIRGFMGNQVIDNLLKLASIYKKENNPKHVVKVALRILDYDDLNEEAIYLQIWALQKADNTHLAKFNFNSFCSKYEKNLGEPYSMNFNEFTRFFSGKL